MRKPTHFCRWPRRLKAYACFYGTDFKGQPYPVGTYVGYTAAQARARCAYSTWMDGKSGAHVWASIVARRVDDPRAIEDHEDQGKYWRDTRAFAHLQAQADNFNQFHPVGTRVLVEDSLLDGQVQQTRTPAWVPSLSCVLVSITGQAGGFALRRVMPLEALEEPVPASEYEPLLAE